MKKFYDEFSRLSIEKMSQAIEDMTYLYKETKVPKKHYKEQLDTQLEQMIADSVSINLLAPYIQTIKALIEQSPKSFFQAMLCVDKKINTNNIKPIEYEALELLFSDFKDKKQLGHLDTTILLNYDNIMKNGVSNYLQDKIINGNKEIN